MRWFAIAALPLLVLAACNETPTTADATASATDAGVVATTNATVEPVPGAGAGGTASPSPNASNTPMPGTSTPIPANAPPSACGADKAAKFVGKTATPDVRAQTIEAVGHNRIRWIGPDTVVTMDFSESRLNMSLDADNRITGAKCG